VWVLSGKRRLPSNMLLFEDRAALRFPFWVIDGFPSKIDRNLLKFD